MGAIVRSPINPRAGESAWQIFGAVNVIVASARTYSPGGGCAIARRPDAMSTATTWRTGNRS